MKRLMDLLGSIIGLVLASPILLPVMFLVWKQDRHSPFYIAQRVGINETLFSMVKLRSMVIGADNSGVDSTSANDTRITNIGKFIRRYKLDEITQLWNVLIGDMSLVGPRPNVKRETDLYTVIEKKLLSVKPGVTDFSSIVFSDEGDILEGKPDPDLAYNQLIRPWKSRLGLIYIDNQSIYLDLKLIFYTIMALVNKKYALACLTRELKALNADDDLIHVSSRTTELIPTPPPGSDKIIEDRRI